MKDKYLAVNETDNSYEFEVIKKDKKGVQKYTLKETNEYLNPNDKTCVVIVDDDEVVVKVDNQVMNIPYYQLAQLFTLLNFINDDNDINFCNYKYYKQI